MKLVKKIASRLFYKIRRNQKIGLRKCKADDCRIRFIFNHSNLIEMLEVSVIGIFSGLLASGILLINRKQAPLANGLLFWVIFPLTAAQFMFYAYLSRLVLEIPFIYRLPAPLYLVIYPAAYLYVRTYLSDRQRLHRKDYLHFLPALLHAIQMVPYHLQPIEFKRAALDELYKHGERMVEFREGGLPPYMQFGILFFQGLIYCTLMYRLIYRSSGSRAPGLLHAGKRWLGLLTTLLLLVAMMLVFTYVVPIAPKDSIVNWWMLSVMLAMAMVTVYLFFQPDILYGVPKVGKHFLPLARIPEMKPDIPTKPVMMAAEQTGRTYYEMRGYPIEAPARVENQVEHETQLAGPDYHGSDFEYLKVYASVIQKHFAETKPFLKKGYAIIHLSEETGIPVHHLSAYLNKVCGTRFNDFINQHRLNYIEEFLGRELSEQFTQEGLAWEAGFSSRISFFNALKKLRGISPAEFLDRARPKR